MKIRRSYLWQDMVWKMMIRIEIDSHGAELKSLVKKETGTEYMWCADPKYWGRTSPVLFPFVGNVSGKQYRTKGKTYDMG